MSTSTEIIEEIHVGDVGTVFQVTLKNGTTVVDLSSITLTSKGFYFESPSGVVLAQPVSFATDGSDGILEYTIPLAVLYEAGVHRLQVFITTATQSWKSSIAEFSVFPNLA